MGVTRLLQLLKGTQFVMKSETSYDRTKRGGGAFLCWGTLRGVGRKTQVTLDVAAAFVWLYDIYGETSAGSTSHLRLSHIKWKQTYKWHSSFKYEFHFHLWQNEGKTSSPRPYKGTPQMLFSHAIFAWASWTMTALCQEKRVLKPLSVIIKWFVYVSCTFPVT